MRFFNERAAIVILAAFLISEIYTFTQCRMTKGERKTMIDQEFLRTQTKRLKWEYDIDYKEISLELLGMDYQAFINWVNGRCKLGRQKAILLQEYIDCIIS